MSRRTWVASALVACGLLVSQQALAVEKASEQVSSFYGSFSHSIPIEVPGFRGLEPAIALSYSSEGRNGFVGVGWNVSGFSTVQRVNAGLGTPRFDSTDVYMLDGQELYPCQVGSVSPSCTTGGTHSTKIESYQRIKFEAGPNTWTVWQKNGTKTVLSPTISVPANSYVSGGTIRWGVSSRVDTDNNTVTYAWSCANGECYPYTATYNGYQIILFWESRPDWQSAAAASILSETRLRLRSIIVWSPTGTAHIRAYKLGYTTSALTGRSLLTSVQQYGKDLVHDGAGLLTGGTTLPAQTFTYQNDAIGKSFADWGSPATRSTYSTGVTWSNYVNSVAVGDGSSLFKNAGSASAWDAGADSTYAIASGDGYVQWIASQPVTDGKAAGLSFGNTDASVADIDFAFGEADSNGLTVLENGVNKGTFTRSAGDILRVEVSSGVVRYKKNGTTLYTSLVAPTYPLRVDASLRGTAAQIESVSISGALINVNAWCQAVLYSGDFNGDGRSDQLCYTSLTGGISRVSLSSATGLLAPTTWMTGGLTNPVFADFNNDGKTDVAKHDAFSGQFHVALSSGTSFAGWVLWGDSMGTAPNGTAAHCRLTPVSVGSGDFNGDGLQDVYCHQFGSNLQFVGLSTGSAFNFSVFSQYSCDTNGDEALGAIDFDGDGKDDWFCIGSDNDVLAVFPSTGSTFLYPAHGTLSFCTGSQYVLADLNGDARTDATCLSNGKVALSTGRGFLEVGTYGAWCGSGGVAFSADVDGDGASEVICNNAGAAATDIQVRKWVGAGVSSALSAPETWRSSWCAGQTAVADWNGDGKSDLYCRSTAAPAVAGTASRIADLVATVSNGLGGVAAVTYASSSSFVNTNNPPVKQVITSLVASDGLGGASATSFSYEGGLMDRRARQFMGFRYVRDQLPCIGGESSCPYVENWFRQDLASAGKLESRVRRAGGGNVLATSDLTYTVNTIAPFTSVLSTESSRSFDGVGCAALPCAQSKTTQIGHQYDAYGNRTQSSYAGDTSLTGDERSTTWHFYPAAAGYLVGYVAKEVHFDQAGAAVAATRYTYDRQGLAASWETPPTKGHVTHLESWLKEESRWTVATRTYDSWGNRTSETDATNRTSQVTYDATRHLFPETSSTPAAPLESSTMLWDPVCGVPQQQTDMNGRVSTFTSDALCRLIRSDYPAAGAAPAGFELIHYRDFGDPAMQRIVVETPPATAAGLNVFSARHFDGLGRSFKLVERGPSSSSAIVSEKAFNARGLLAVETNKRYATEASQLTYYSYDFLNRRITTLHPDGTQRSTTYGLWSETATDEEGRATTRHFDAYGRVKSEDKVLDGDAVTTSFVHDSLGRMSAMAGPLGVGWTWTYDSLGRVVSKSDPDSGTWTFQFDDADRTTRQIDAKAQRTDYGYDVRGRVQSISTYGSGGALSSTVTYTYGQARAGYYNIGQLTTVTGPGTTSLEYDYDARMRPVKLRRTLDGSVYGMARTFDSGDRIVSLQFPDLESFAVGYDESGRMKSVAGVLTNVLWDAEGRVTQLTHADGSVTNRTYSAERGFLGLIQTTGAGMPAQVQDLNYEHDNSGLVTSVASSSAGESWGYSYDGLGRLTDATTVPPSVNSQTWQYDHGGRMTFNSRIGAYSYGSGYRPLTAGASSFTYDANGNMLTGGGKTFTWTPENVLASVNTTTFVYDDEGDRLKKTVGASVSRYPVGDAYEITDGVITKYFRVPGVGLVGKKVTGGSQAGTYAIHTDHLGSVRSVTKVGAGNQELRRSYRPYGEQLAASGTNVESYGWIQERSDQSTGLTFLHARYYDASLGVLVSADPLDARFRDQNSYGYSAGDPINFFDPSGLDPEPPSFPTGIDCPGDPGCPPPGDDNVGGPTIPWDGYGGFPKHDERRGNRRNPDGKRGPNKTPRNQEPPKEPTEPPTEPPDEPTEPNDPQCLLMGCDDPGGEPNDNNNNNNNNNQQSSDDGMVEKIEIVFDYNETDGLFGGATGTGIGVIGNAGGVTTLGPGAALGANVLIWGTVVARFNAMQNGRYHGVIVRVPRNTPRQPLPRR